MEFFKLKNILLLLCIILVSLRIYDWVSQFEKEDVQDGKEYGLSELWKEAPDNINPNVYACKCGIGYEIESIPGFYSFGGPHFFSSLLYRHITLDLLEAMASTTLYQSGNSLGNVDLHNEEGFEQYNPKFINWIAEQADIILSQPTVVNATQTYYNRYYKTIFREYYDSFVHLKTHNTETDQLIFLYKNLLVNKHASNFILPDWIGQKIQEKYTEQQYWATKNYANAYKFWIRRLTGGSADQLFEILEDVIRVYD